MTIAVYGIDAYGPPTLYGGLAPAVDYAVPTGLFTVFSPDFGVAQVRWADPPGDWTALRLLRNNHGPALDEIDGVELLSRGRNGPMDFRETGLHGGRWAYYTLFVLGADLVWHRAGDQALLLAVDHGYSAKLYSLLPEIFCTGQDSVLTDPGVENEALQQFLTIFGRQLDYLRTSLDGLGDLMDVDRVPASVLPALAHQVGLEDEPELGAATMRRLIRNATRLYRLKGSATCLRELAALVTGWSATVRLGVNLLLDSLDSVFDGSTGRWGATATNVVVGYRAGDNAVTAYVGDGMMTLTTPVAGSFSVSFTDATRSRYTGVPIRGSVRYAASVHLRSAVVGLGVRLQLDWYDAHNTLLATSPGVAVVPSTSDWSVRADVLAQAPAEAAFAGLTLLSSTSWPIAGRCYVGGVQLEESYYPTDFQPARQIQIVLDADVVNHIANPTGEHNTADWSGENLSAATLEGTGTFVLTAQAGQTGMLAGSSTRVPVSPGEEWQFSTYIRDPVGHSPQREAQVTIHRYVGAASLGSDEPTIGTGVYQDTYTATYTSSSSGQSGDEDTDSVDGGSHGLLDANWRRFAVVYRVPDDGSVTHLSVVVTVACVGSGNAFAAGETYQFRRVLFTPHSDPTLPYFDGSTPSATSEYLWEGVPHASRSHYYRRRTIKAYRLRALLPRFSPPGTDAVMLFAVESRVLVGPDTSVADAVIAPLVIPPRPPVGRSLTMPNAGRRTVGASTEVLWQTRRTTGSSRALRWNTLHL